MDTTTLLLMGILILLPIVRTITMRTCAIKHDPAVTVCFISFWLLLGSLALFPFQKELLYAGMATFVETPWVAFMGILKGISLLIGFYQGQVMKKISVSSVAYRGPLLLGLVAIMNSYFGEELSLIQWGAIISLFILGILFVARGHLNELHTRYKWMFLSMVLIGGIPAVCDHVVISHTNWYTLLVLYSLTMAAGVLMYQRKLSFWKTTIMQKENLVAGSVFIVTEVFLMFVLVTYIPVTMAVLSMTLATPIMMMISALLWKESTWRNQLAFGGLAYIVALPVIIF